MSTRALRSEVETAIERRGAEVYAGFLRRHLRPDMVVLDCGCGKATIALGLAEAMPDGRVVGVDLDQGSLTIAGRYAAAMERRNLELDDGLAVSARGGSWAWRACLPVPLGPPGNRTPTSPRWSRSIDTVPPSHGAASYRLNPRETAALHLG